MPGSLPTSISLTSIADGSLAVAADMRTNNSAVQTAVNALIAANGVTAKGDLLAATGSGALTNVAVGANSKALIADSTQTAGMKWDYPPGYEFVHTQIVAGVNITDTLEATATALITAASFTADGAAVMVEVFVPLVVLPVAAAGTATLIFSLFEGATQIGRIGQFVNPGASAAAQTAAVFRHRFTPTAATHTYKLCAFTSTVTGTPSIQAGGGGTNTYVPAYLRITKV